LNARSIIIRDQ